MSPAERLLATDNADLKHKKPSISFGRSRAS